MHYEEIEVKFILDDLPAMRQRVIAMGADCKTPRTYEVNVLFDTPDQRLHRQDCLLRLRSDQRHVLTYKEPAPAAEQDFKVRHEYEVEVSDFSTAQAVLGKLGFVPVWRYEKYRETFTYQDTEILLDDTPCGAFLEIEGSREAIRVMASTLGLDFETRLTASYSRIFAAVCAAYQLQVTDMTFENFRTLAIDIRTCQLT
jgi:adenylate cyclase, class 2